MNFSIKSIFQMPANIPIKKSKFKSINISLGSTNDIETEYYHGNNEGEDDPHDENGSKENEGNNDDE